MTRLSPLNAYQAGFSCSNIDAFVLNFNIGSLLSLRYVDSREMCVWVGGI